MLNEIPLLEMWLPRHLISTFSKSVQDESFNFVGVPKQLLYDMVIRKGVLHLVQEWLDPVGVLVFGSSSCFFDYTAHIKYFKHRSLLILLFNKPLNTVPRWLSIIFTCYPPIWTISFTCCPRYFPICVNVLVLHWENTENCTVRHVCHAIKNYRSHTF